MSLLTFIISKRLSYLFGNSRRWKITLLLCGMAVNGIVFGFFARTWADRNKVADSDFMETILLTAFGMTILMNFLPVYRKRLQFIEKIHPQHVITVSLYNTLAEFFSISFLSLTLFLLPFLFVLCKIPVAGLLSGMLAVISGLVCSRHIRALIEHQAVKKSLFTITGIGIFILFVVVYRAVPVKAISFAGILLAAFVMECLFEHFRQRRSSVPASVSNASPWRYCFINRKSRVTLLFALSLKFIALMVFLRLPPEVNWLANLFILSPLILFTYLYNNAWSFFYGLWIRIQIRENKWIDFFSSYCKLLAYPLFLDGLMTFASLAYFGMLDFFYLQVYIISVIMMTLTGFVTSLIRPIETTSAVNFMNARTSTSTLGVTIDCLIVGLVWLPSVHVYFGILEVVCCAIAVSVVYRSASRIFQFRYEVFAILNNRSTAG
jgi:hypothetical protein